MRPPRAEWRGWAGRKCPTKLRCGAPFSLRAVRVSGRAAPPPRDLAAESAEQQWRWSCFPGNRRGLAKAAHRGRLSQSLAPLKCSVRARRDGREVAGLARGPGGLARLAAPASAAPRPPRLPRDAFSRAQSDGKKIEKLSETNVLLSSSLPLPARRHPPLKHKPEITPFQIGLLESTHYKYRHAWR